MTGSAPRRYDGGEKQRLLMSVDRPRLQLLHTADVHIGDDYAPARRLEGLRAVADAAIGRDVQAVLIAGDLFDNARVKQPDVDAALAQLARLAPRPTIITSGNHDSLATDSIYRRIPLAEAGPHIYLLDGPQGQRLVLPDLCLTVWSRALVEHHPGHRPLAGYEPGHERHWSVVMAHGHYVPEDERPERSSPILAQEIAALQCDYVALGHWHRFLDCSINGTPAFYPGSPSEAGGTFPGANLVTFDPVSGVRVERVPFAPAP